MKTGYIKITLIFLLAMPAFGRVSAFEPTPFEKLKDKISELNSKKNEIASVERDFKFDDSIDGKKGRYTSNLEDALYVTLVFGESQKDISDALYYFMRCLIMRDKVRITREAKYLSGYLILEGTAKSTYKMTVDDLRDIEIRAISDHLTENNESAKKLISANRQRVVLAVSQEFVLGNERHYNEIFFEGITLASEKPVSTDTYRAYTSLVESILNRSDVLNVLNVILLMRSPLRDLDAPEIKAKYKDLPEFIESTRLQFRKRCESHKAYAISFIDPAIQREIEQFCKLYK